MRHTPLSASLPNASHSLPCISLECGVDVLFYFYFHFFSLFFSFENSIVGNFCFSCVNAVLS